MPVRPPNASSSKGEKPVPPNKPAIAAKPKPLTAKPVPRRKPIGIKVLPVPQKRPKVNDEEKSSENSNSTADVTAVNDKLDGAKEEIAITSSDDVRSVAPKTKSQVPVRVLPVPPKDIHENYAHVNNQSYNVLIRKTEESNGADVPIIQPRTAPRQRPVPQKRKSIVKKEFESLAVNPSKISETQEIRNKRLNGESVKIAGVTSSASSDSSHAPTFETKTDDGKVRIRDKAIGNKEETSVKRKSSFVPTRKAPPPPMKPKAPKPQVKTSEGHGTKRENLNNLAKSKGQTITPAAPITPVAHSPHPTNQTASNAKTPSTAQSQLSSSKIHTGQHGSNEEGEDSPMRPPRPNRLKKRLSCEGLLNDNLNDVAQSSQESTADKIDETNKNKGDNVKPQVPGKINIKQFEANLYVSAVKALKFQTDTKNKPRPMTKVESEDIPAENTEIIMEASEKLVNSKEKLTVESITNETSVALQKELSERTTAASENNQKNVFSLVGMGSQDIFSHSFSQSNNDLRRDSPSLKNGKRSLSNEDLSAVRGQRLSRSHTVECLFDDTGNDDDIYEVIPDSPNSPLTPTAARNRTSRRLSRSSSVGQLLDLPPRNFIGSRRGKPVFVPPPPPPCTPPDSASPQFANFPRHFMMEKSFQTSAASDERMAHSTAKSIATETAHDTQQPHHDILDYDYDVYEDTENMEHMQDPVPQPAREVPPTLPRKESVRTPNNNKLALLASPTKSTPKRIPSREAPPPPVRRPATGRQESKTSIPSMEAPTPFDDQVLAPDVDENIYDDEGYLAPTRMQITNDGDYSYADMPDDSSSPIKPESSLIRKDSISRDDRQSITSTDSHIYESIGSMANTDSVDMKDTANRQSGACSKGSNKDRESNVSNVSRSVFYFEVDEEEKAKIERELSRTDVRTASESGEKKGEDDYQIPPEVEAYMGPAADESGIGVDLDVEVPLPPRPPLRKRKPGNDGTNQTEEPGDESEDDYIYPGDPEDEGEKKRDENTKGSDDDSYHYPADLSMEAEPQSPDKPPVLPPRQKSNESSSSSTKISPGGSVMN